MDNRILLGELDGRLGKANTRQAVQMSEEALSGLEGAS